MNRRRRQVALTFVILGLYLAILVAFVEALPHDDVGTVLSMAFGAGTGYFVMAPLLASIWGDDFLRLGDAALAAWHRLLRDE